MSAHPAALPQLALPVRASTMKEVHRKAPLGVQLLCNQNEALTMVTSDLTLGADGLAQLRC